MKQKLIITLVFTILIKASNALAICCPLIIDAQMIAEVLLMAGMHMENASITGDRDDNFVEFSEEFVSNEKDLQGAIKSAAEGDTSAFASTLKEHAITQRVVKQTSYLGPSSQSSYACCSEDIKGIPSGDASRRNQDDTIYKNMLDRNEKYLSTYEVVNELKTEYTTKKAEDVVDGKHLFPLEGSLNKDELTAGTILANFITNPVPPAQLKEGQLNTNAGETYEMLRKTYLIRLAPAQKAFSTLLASRAPVYDMKDWADELANSMGTGGEMLEIKEGKLSEDQVMKARIAARYDNPNWSIDLHKKTRNGLLRELVVMKSIKLELLRRRLETAMTSRTILASNLAIKLDTAYNPTLDKANKKAILTHGN